MPSFLAQVQAILATTAARWQALTETVDVDLLTRPPRAGEWSAADCLQHLVDTERFVFPARVRAILASQDFAAYDPDAEGTVNTTQTPTQLAAEFANLRAESLPLLASLTPADLPRTARHADLGVVTLEQLLHEWVGHDLMHTVQGERSLMQPFIAGSGPWRHYFKDHDTER